MIIGNEYRRTLGTKDLLTSGSPLVSVIVNSYNYGHYLPDCLNALLSQSYQNIEIIAVDALSTDESRAILEDYAAKDNRVRLLFCQKHERYPAITYNLGFLNATGQFIAIADPDDISLQERIERQVQYLLSHPDVDVCGTNCREFNEHQDVLVETTVEKNVAQAAPPARNPSLMFKRELLATHGMWNWKCEYAADFEWLYRWYCNGVKFHIIEDCCLMYRYSHGTNVSVSKRVNQTLKLALFRSYFGIRLIGRVGIPWWRMTLITWAYWFKLWLARLLRA